MIDFSMKQIKVEQFAILSETLPKDSNVNVESTFSVSVDSKSHTVGMRVKINYLAEKEVLLTLTLVCMFAISDESWNSLISNDVITIPRGFLVHMAVHTLGTARGVLFCKAEGTVFQQIILRPMNVDAAFKEDIALHNA